MEIENEDERGHSLNRTILGSSDDNNINFEVILKDSHVNGRGHGAVRISQLCKPSFIIYVIRI